MASYYFPPDAAVGGLRLGRFVRMLPEFGWRPVVLTVRDEYRDQGFDAGRLAGLEDICIVRTGEFPRLSRRLRTLVAPIIERTRHRPAETADVFVGATATPGRRGRVVARLKRWIISLAVLLPDDKKHWAGRAAFTAVRLIRRGNIQYVLTSGPPFSTHWIGVVAKSLTRCRWIADFRDPWVDMLSERFDYTRSPASDRVERWMEAVVARTADTVVVTTPRMLEAFRSRYPSIERDKFVCIPNTIDTDRFSAAPEPRAERLTITYAGSLYFDRTPEPLFQAVSDLIASGRIASRDIRIRLVGRCGTINGVDTQTIVRRYGLEAVVEVLDPVPYAEAIRMMQRSHLLLVLAPECHRLVVPAKIYDYLGSGSKVLAIAEPGATADLMAKTGSGRCFAEADLSGLRDYLEQLVADGSFRSLKNEPESFSRYDARHLTARLAARMDPQRAGVGGKLAVRG